MHRQYPGGARILIGRQSTRSVLARSSGRHMRSKGDQDPAEWLKLTVDEAEYSKLTQLAKDCTDSALDVEPAS